MSLTCDFCNQTFTARTNLNRHKRKFHSRGKGMCLIQCQECNYSTCHLKDMEKHIGSDRQISWSVSAPRSILNKSVFWETDEGEALDVFLEKILWSRVGLSCTIWVFLDICKFSGFQGKIQYRLAGIHGQLEWTTRKNIEPLVLDKVQAYPQKVQFIAHIDLMKPAPLNESEEKETKLYANSEWSRVYSDGLIDDEFLDMVGKMLSLLFIFASVGGVWVVSQISHLDV